MNQDVLGDFGLTLLKFFSRVNEVIKFLSLGKREKLVSVI